MIKSYGNKETEKINKGRFSKKLPNDIQRIAARKLKMINDAAELKDLRAPPSNRLETMKGDRKGQCSIRINNQWRICFKWTDGHAYHVEIIDYH